MLSDAQKRHFEVFGFLVLRQVFSASEIDEIRRESDRILRDNRSGRDFLGIKRQAMIPFFEHSPLLMALMEDDRVFDLATDLLGPNFILNASEGNLHVGDTHWHAGGPVPEPVPHIKIAFYLEPTTRDTGALRLIPGSNRPTFWQSLQPLNDSNEDLAEQIFGVPGDQVPCQVVETEPGDLVIFPESTWHAAFGGSPGRSQHAISFMADPVTDAQLAYISELHGRYNFSLHPPLPLVDSDRPRLRGMVDKLVRMGFGPPQVTPPFE